MQSKYFVFLIFSFLSFFMITTSIKRDQIYSKKENRLYVQKPEITMEGILKRTFMRDMEQYLSDQFYLRNAFLDLTFLSERLLGKQDRLGIYFGNDGYRMKIETYDDMSIANNIDILNDFCKKYNAELYLIPTSAYILEKKLPYFIEDKQQKQIFQDLKKYTWVNLMDEVLLEHKDEYIYYRSDHHMTLLGAQYVYESWAKDQMVKPWYPTLSLVSSQFLGSYAREANDAFMKSDNLYIIEEADAYIEHILLGDTKKLSLYEQSYLQKGDGYMMYLHGNHPKTTITTTVKNNRHLVVFKDSYANSFVPFLVPYYETITMIDLQMYQGELELDKYDDVLLFYGINTLGSNQFQVLQ